MCIRDRYYDIEFEVKGVEFEYKIDAMSGQVLKYERDDMDESDYDDDTDYDDDSDHDDDSDYNKTTKPTEDDSDFNDDSDHDDDTNYDNDSGYNDGADDDDDDSNDDDDSDNDDSNYDDDSGFDAVSYTHLDVYKRQALVILFLNLSMSFEKKKRYLIRGSSSSGKTTATGLLMHQLIHFLLTFGFSSIRIVFPRENPMSEHYNTCLLYTSRCV